MRLVTCGSCHQQKFGLKKIVDEIFFVEKVEPGFPFSLSAVQPQDDAGVGGHHHQPGQQHNGQIIR